MHAYCAQSFTQNSRVMDVEQLVVDNLAWIEKTARFYCIRNFDAEDLANDTIEKILRSKTKYDAGRGFRPWVKTIMANTYITAYNHKRLIPFVCVDAAYSLASSICADHDMAIANIISAIRKCARKSVAIECVVLYAKGYNYEEIAIALGIPKGTVMSRICNGRKLLRRALTE